MGVDLDRFSQPLTSEYKRTFSDGPITYEVEEVVVCKGCNKVLYEEDAIIPSEYWEDDYMHDDTECIERYYQNAPKPRIRYEKDPFAANKRVG